MSNLRALGGAKARLAALAAACAAVALGGGAWGMKLDKNLDALRAAIDPAHGPPLVEPVFPKHNPDPELGPPGPYTPERPERDCLAGAAVLHCSLAADGRLNRCALVADGPLNFDYGSAALKMAGDGYMRAKPPQTFSDGEEVRVLVIFPRPKGQIELSEFSC